MAQGQGGRRDTRILVIDDDPAITEAVGTALWSAGHDVTTAVDGQGGIDRFLATGGYELVLTNLRMPRMDGFEVARRIKALRPETPVLLLTGWPFDEEPDVAAFRALGFAALIRKPFQIQDLLGAVTDALPAKAPLPFADASTRRAPRYPCGLPVQVSHERGPTTQPGHLLDLSEGGVGLILPRALSPGTEIELQLNLAGLAVGGIGEVIWAAPTSTVAEAAPCRHGIRLRELASPTEEGIYRHCLARLATDRGGMALRRPATSRPPGPDNAQAPN